MRRQWFSSAKRIGSALLFLVVFPGCVTPIEAESPPNVILDALIPVSMSSVVVHVFC